MSMNWQKANQQYLMAAVDEVRALLEWYVTQKEGMEMTDRRRATKERLQMAAAMMPARSALDALCVMFDLNTFERQLLLLCAAIELDASVAFLCAAAQGSEKRNYITFDLARTIFSRRWKALSPAGTLRRWQLIEVGIGQALTSSPLRLNERILLYLAGVNTLDARLAGVIEPAPSPSSSGAQSASKDWEEAGSIIPASHRALVEQVVNIWQQASEGSRLPLIQWCGTEVTNRLALATAVCEELELELYCCWPQRLPTTASELQSLRRLWERETLLSDGVLLFECDEVEAKQQQALRWLIEHMGGPIMLSGEQRVRPYQRTTVAFDLPALSAAEQRTLWQQALGPFADGLNRQVTQLVSQFNLNGPAIQAVSASGLAHIRAKLDQSQRRRGIELADETIAELEEQLWERCRVQARPHLDELAQRIVPAASWQSLVLPELQRNILRDIVTHIRRRQKVYEEWGFASKSGRGLGISALFAGASGTGKTMAAEVLASELRLDLYRIDLSAVVSKYIGETEKNLRRIFDAAESGGVILLFDEADALFGKRSEVKDSHDRHANIEVSYLLQRMEAYRGLAILTTNLRSALDSAFLRRIRFIVQFPFPSATQRVKIWQRIFPSQTPTEGLDIYKLAQLNIAGGHIRNIAMNAAFQAADADEPVRMSHLLHATRHEYQKLEKQLTRSELHGWEVF